LEDIASSLGKIYNQLQVIEKKSPVVCYAWKRSSITPDPEKEERSKKKKRILTSAPKENGKYVERFASKPFQELWRGLILC